MGEYHTQTEIIHNSPFHAPPTDDDEYDAPSASVNLCKQHSERFHCKYWKCPVYLRIFTENSIQGSDILQRESCSTILLNEFAKETIICTLHVELLSFCANDSVYFLNKRPRGHIAHLS
jgi:hypothetical protein